VHAVGAGASGALNMWYEADIDAPDSATATARSAAAVITPAGSAHLGMTLAFFSGDDARHPRQLVAGALLAFTIFSTS